MATEAPFALRDGTRKAGADLSAASNQFKFVKLDGSGDVVLCTAATDVPYGVLQNTPRLGEAADVVIIGITKLVAGGALATPGTLIGTDASGRADAKTPGTDTTEYVAGVTVGTSGAAGEIIRAVVNCAAPSRAA